MRKIRDVLRLSAACLSKRKIARASGSARQLPGTVLPDGVTDEALERRLYPPSAIAAKESRPRLRFVANCGGRA